MPNELTDLLDSTIYKEIASPTSHITGQSQTQHPARELMKELTEEGLAKQGGYQNKVPNLMTSEYLVGSDKLEGTGLQTTPVFTMKREQRAIKPYSKNDEHSEG